MGYCKKEPNRLFLSFLPMTVTIGMRNRKPVQEKWKDSFHERSVWKTDKLFKDIRDRPL